MENKLLYPISINYGKKDWNIVSALRELLSNMLDTKGEYEFGYSDGWAAIRDYGIGLSKKDFIFGESTRDQSQIGQFGEGLKMALITLLRYNRKAIIKTMDFSVTAEKTNFDNAEVMQLTFGKDTLEKGTMIMCQCTQAELDEAANLFLSLRKDLTKVDTGIFLPAGDIHVLGLKTSTLPNLIFSYDFNDKTMTNRDRNIVDNTKLNHNIQYAINKLKNLKAIKVFIENIENKPTALEYQNCYNIEHIDVWKKAIATIYGNKVCVSTDLQSDLHAYVMGYKVLRNITPQLSSLLTSTLSIQKSSIVAQNYDKTGLVQKEKIVYPISAEYCSSWTIRDAIREFIANAIDTGSEMRVEWKDGFGRIVDSGSGIHKKHFIFGVSEGKGLSNIGQFGEGLKVASLVLARYKRKVEIQTVGYTYSAGIEKNDEFDTNLFTVFFKKNNRTKGTIISFECSENELEEAKKLFCVFRSGKAKTVSTSRLDVFIDEPSKVYINGLFTSKHNTIFGYNIKDKSLVNSRDRNGIDTSRFIGPVVDMLSTTTDESIVEGYLKAWQKEPYAIEYQQGFTIRNKEVWEKIVKKEFKKCCIASSYNDQANFVAKQADYTILRNVPAFVSKILSDFKVPSADAIAKKYENSGILIGEKLVYPISANYCLGWSIKDAIRELISNALDTKAKVHIGYNDGYAIISDKGEGIAKKNLLFGMSAKENDQIGQFGEGLKMASLVLARNNREFKLVTKGYEYQAKIEKDKEFNADVLVLHLKKSKKRIGTDITFKCSEAELTETKKLFLQYDASKTKVDTDIYSPGGSIYVNGVYVTSGNYLFSYNLTDKSRNMLSRDRKTIDPTVVRNAVAKLIEFASSEEFIKKYMRPSVYKEESYLESLNLSYTVKPVWERTLKKLYPKHCLQSFTEHDLAAKDKGYTLLTNFTDTQLRIFRACGFESSSKVIVLKGDEKFVELKFDPKKLSDTGKTRWKVALKQFKKLYGKAYATKIEIVEKFNVDTTGPDTVGLYVPTTDTVYILKSLIENDWYEEAMVLGVLIHEHMHRISGAADRTREFENALTNELGRIGLMI